MRTHIIKLTLIFIILTSPLIAQQQIRISGSVKDKLSGENLIGANIVEQGTIHGISSDYNGYFSIAVNAGSSLQISYLGYKNYLTAFDLKKDTIINVFLSPDTEQLDEVIVSASRTPRFNIATINYQQMTQIPSIGGKPDVIKSLQLMPGISYQNEGSSLMLVRGGDPGQNLYLFDNVPLIYVNHLGGFMSVFNPDIINNIDVYKGGFPARYGGKLSSVVDITQREGNNSGLKGSLGIGITDASFTLEGPLKIENSTFIITGRKTMIDPLMAFASSLSGGSNYIVSYGFHDINGKFTWKPDNKNSFSLNVYQGDDYLNYWSRSGTNSGEKYRLSNVWGNWLVSARLNSIVSPKLYASNKISFTRYRLKESMKYTLTNAADTSKLRIRYISAVQDLSYRSDWKYNALKNWTMDFGLHTSLLRFSPNDSYISTRTTQQTSDISNSLETALYTDNKITFLRNSTATLGLRFVNYITNDYMRFSLEPRININLSVAKNHVLNASYMRVSQFSHLAFTTGSIMNNEVWIPAGKKVPAAKSDQYTFGWNGDYRNDMFSSEINLYYKNMSDLSTFREGYTNLMGDETWATKIESGGKGESVGAEFLVRKNSGKWTGFVSYSRTRTTRQYPNINNGVKYIFDYNRPNSLSLNISYKLNEKLSFNLLWVYQTGLPFTPAIGRYYVPSLENNFEGNSYYYEALIYGERNSSEMRDYHRLDIGLSYSTLTKKRKNKAIWNFSVYNVYNRHNPVYYYYNSNNTGEIFLSEWGGEYAPLSLYQLSLFPIIPTLSYKVFFDFKPHEIKSVSTREKDRVPFKQKFGNWINQNN
ncbi:MAG: TonB-dependent receptor [Bacteroidetes bacterium]|nr:TonB-dependent receptor [Bacteroidota bacterium]